MELYCLFACSLALFLSIVGFLGGCWAVVQVLAWQRSTHRVVQVADNPTRVELDVPQHVIDQLPSPPDAQTLEQYLKAVHNKQLEDELNDFE